MKKLSLLILPFILFGCAFGKDSATDNKKEVQERQKLKETYSRVEGLYTGTLTTASNTQDIELLMFTDDVREGVNSDGSDRFRLVLKGTYTRLNPAGASRTLNGRFIPETNEVILSNPATNLGPDDVKTISAKLIGDRLIGEVKRETGIIGVIDLKLQSQKSGLPDSSEKERQNERARETLRKVAGKYEGLVLPPPQLMAPFAIGIDLFISEVTGPNGATPQLVAYYKRLDEPSGTLDLQLATSFDPEVTPARITFNGKGGGTYNIFLDGYVAADGTIKGVFKNQKGFVGNFELKKVSEQ